MTQAVTIPELNLWLLRAGADTTLAADMLRDPLLFYALYAAVDGVIEWPDGARSIRQEGRSPRSTEDMLKLMSALSAKTSVRVSSEYIALFQEAAGVFTFYQGHAPEFALAISHALEATLERQRTRLELSSISMTLDDLGDLADFTDLDKGLVSMAFTLRASVPFMMFMELAFESKQRARRLIPVMLNCEPTALLTAMGEDGALAKSGLLPASGRGRKLLPLSEFWTDFLSDGASSLSNIFGRLLKPFEVKDSTGAVGRLHADDAQVVKALIMGDADADTNPSINVLLYGAATVDKKGVVAKLLNESELTGWVLEAKNADDSDLGSLCFFAQRALTKAHPSGVLVVEKAPSVLSGRKRTQFMFFSFESEDDNELKSADEVLLMENPVRTIWLSTTSAKLSEESLGCFLYHSEIKRASRAERRQKVEGIIRSLGFSSKLEQELSLQAGLSEQQIKNAVTVARLIAKNDPVKAEAHILQAVTRSQQALDRREKDDLRIPVTQYSLEYLNTSGQFGAEQIIAALKRRPSGALCFYGIPGTGKSQLAEYMAGELDKPLLVRRASELLDKYVGESEKRIAEMFAEAEAEDAVLLLDEADTFLRDRTTANQQWEVSLVNELLQRMERFPGIFICATNLFQQLDAASLRRFTFKLEFKELTDDQRWDMFLNESGLGANGAELSADIAARIREELSSIEMLTPGDFATVKRQCILLDQQLTPDEWLNQLALEAAMKKASITERKMGFN